MHEEHLPEDDHGKLMHVVEECAEVQQAICKLIRFGMEGVNPYMKPQLTNRHRVLSEMDDLQAALAKAREVLLTGECNCDADPAHPIQVPCPRHG